ncbi:MAG: porin family protein [Betaproteobacteria bacterium]|nr:porin family protein [Betaproteobacteria bacterium]
MKNKTSLAAFVAAITLAFPASAEENSETKGFYFSIGLNQIALNNYCESARAVGTVTSCSDSEIGVEGKVGYKFNDYIGAEAGIIGNLGFLGLGGFETTIVDQGRRAEIKLDVFSFPIGFRGKLPLGENFYLTGAGGVHFWQYEASSGFNALSLDGTDPYYGVGAGYQTESISFRLEWTRYQDDDDGADVISGNLVINF